MDVFQYLPNFGLSSNIEFMCPLSVHTSDHLKEQRVSTSALKEYTYQSTKTYYELDTIRKYSAEYSAIGTFKDSTLVNRLQALRDDTILLPFFLEPLAATEDLAGLSFTTLDTGLELAGDELKFISSLVVRLDIADRDFFEYRTMTSTKEYLLNNGAFASTPAWSASIPAWRCRLYFLDKVYCSSAVQAGYESDQVHHLKIDWVSI